ncbi:MAG: class B sortase [Oscillospiraceae bacterium]|nr:class B sortase [Oscillospiraceae bacterium]
MAYTKRYYLRLSVLTLAVLLLISTSVAACANRQEEPEPEPPPLQEEEYIPIPAEPPERMPLFELPPSFLERIAEKYARNSDTVGWLYVPNTSIDDVVVHYPHDENEFYLRRNFERRTSMSGVYFADFRNTFDGTAAGLSRNTVIYGHSLDWDDDPDAPYFDQLKRFLDEDFARENPYIFFSVAGEDLVWEVFSVYYATRFLPYNLPDFTDAGFIDILDQIKKRSQFIYDVDVGLDDKILTLSTCTYIFTPGVFPNNYRFVISARLMEEGADLPLTAELVRNPTPHEP